MGAEGLSLQARQQPHVSAGHYFIRSLLLESFRPLPSGAGEMQSPQAPPAPTFLLLRAHHCLRLTLLIPFILCRPFLEEAGFHWLCSHLHPKAPAQRTRPIKIGQHHLPDAPNSCLGESQGGWVRGISARLEAFLEQGGFYVHVISTT